MFHLCEDEVREFSQAPFWFWNDELNEGEISRQLDEFQAHGVHAFVIHPRAGLLLKTNYCVQYPMYVPPSAYYCRN